MLKTPITEVQLAEAPEAPKAEEKSVEEKDVDAGERLT